MPIQVHCSNGHVLHVKSSYAGKRVACPHCGVALEVPAAPSVAADPAQPAAPAAQAATGTAGNAPSAGPWANPVQPKQKSGRISSQGNPPAQKPAPPVNDMGVEWYVADAHGNRQGPLTQADFTSRLQARHVPAEALIWRTGWSEWQTAGTALPNYFTADGLPSAPIAAQGAPAPAPAAPAIQPVVNAPLAGAPFVIAPQGGTPAVTTPAMVAPAMVAPAMIAPATAQPAFQGVQLPFQPGQPAAPVFPGGMPAAVAAPAPIIAPVAVPAMAVPVAGMPQIAGGMPVAAAGQPAAPFSGFDPTAPKSAEAAKTTNELLSAAQRRRKSRTNMYIILSVLLALIMLGLIPVVVFVIMRN